MMFKLILFAGVIAVARSASRCCNGGLCFDDNPPFDHLPLPHCPEEIKPTLMVYTKANPMTGRAITRTSIPSVHKGSRQTIFISHGWTGSSNINWLHEMKDELLKQGDYNVIIVGWEGGAQNIYYPQSASDTRAVGAEVGLVAANIIARGNSRRSRLYCIGFSLGAHVCGHAGMKTKFGRVTGLDPAGPLFERKSLTVGLNPSSADFVDVLHTDGKKLINLGTMKVLGHVDFYPNGAGRQPGCIFKSTEMTGNVSVSNENNTTAAATDNDDDITEIEKQGLTSCSHSRAVEYFIESIRTPCFYSRQKCTDQGRLPGSCTSSRNPVQSMGFDSNSYKGRGIFYLTTKGSKPFCNN